MEPTVYSDEVMIRSPRGLSPEELKGAVEGFLSWIASRIYGGSGELIGHIKCFLSVKNGSGLFASIVSAAERPSCKGELRGPVNEAKLSRAAILYGAERKEIERLMEEGLKRFFAFDG